MSDCRCLEIVLPRIEALEADAAGFDLEGVKAQVRRETAMQFIAMLEWNKFSSRMALTGDVLVPEIIDMVERKFIHNE